MAIGCTFKKIACVSIPSIVDYKVLICALLALAIPVIHTDSYILSTVIYSLGIIISCTVVQGSLNYM